MINLTTIQFTRRTKAPTIAQERFRDGTHKDPRKQLLEDLLAFIAFLGIFGGSLLAFMVFG
jgi:hypothetical protein